MTAAAAPATAASAIHTNVHERVAASLAAGALDLAAATSDGVAADPASSMRASPMSRRRCRVALQAALQQIDDAPGRLARQRRPVDLLRAGPPPACPRRPRPRTRACRSASRTARTPKAQMSARSSTGACRAPAPAPCRRPCRGSRPVSVARAVSVGEFIAWADGARWRRWPAPWRARSRAPSRCRRRAP